MKREEGGRRGGRGRGKMEEEGGRRGYLSDETYLWSTVG
jgi:hypothetical protein